MTAKFRIMTDHGKKVENFDDRLKRLTTVLEVYGAKSALWPEEERRFLLKLIKENIEADQIYQEAVALEHVLDQVAVSKDMTSLQSAIMAKITEQASVRNQTVNSKVIDLASRQKTKAHTGLSYSDMLQNTALLAAALILGIYIGTTDFIGKLYPFAHDDSANIVSLVPAPVDENGLPYEENFL